MVQFTLLPSACPTPVVNVPFHDGEEASSGVSVTLEGDAYVDDAGVHVDGVDGFARIRPDSPWSYGTEGDFTISLWFRNWRWTDGIFEYLFSHIQGDSLGSNTVQGIREAANNTQVLLYTDR